MAASGDCCTYLKKANKAVMGYEFEEKLCAFIIINVTLRREPFCVAANMVHADKFDDIVVSVGKGEQRHTYALQLKHKDAGMVTYQALASEFSDLGVCKYFDSYCRVKRGWQLEPDLQSLGPADNFIPILYTNAGHKVSGLMTESARCDVLPDEGEVFGICEGQLKQEMVQHCGTDKDKLALINEFCSKFLFCTKQPSPCDFDKLIILKIQQHCKVSYAGALRICEKFLQSVTSWCRDKKPNGIFITNNNFSQFFPKVIHRSRPERPEPPEHLTKSDISHVSNFNCEKLASFKEELPLGNSGILLLRVEHRALSLACVKVRLAFPEAIVLDVCTAVQMKDELIYVWPSEGCRILVLECTSQYSALLPYLIGCFISDKLEAEMWQLILITDNYSFTEVASACSPHVPVVKQFTCEFSHFTLEFRESIMSRMILFQGRQVPIGSLLPADSNFNRDIINGLLPKLLDDQCLIEVGRKMPELPEFYTKRRVKIYNTLKSNIFWSRDLFLLAISGVTEHDLEKYLLQHIDTELVGSSDFTVCSSNNVCKYKVITSQAEFDDLCQTNSNVHWLHMHGTALRWRQSHGDRAVISKHLVSSGRVCWEDDVLQVLSGTVIVTAEADIGRTTLVNSLVKTMTHGSKPLLWVVFVSVDSMEQWLSSNSKTPGLLSVTDVLKANAHANCNKFASVIFDQFLQLFPSKLVVIVDDFQEFYTTNPCQCISFIRELQQLHLKCIIISVRMMKTINLEHQLNAVKICLQPLCKQQCKILISKLWNFWRSDKLSKNDLTCVIEKLVKATDSKFVGNPCHLIKFLETIDSRERLLNEDINLLNVVNHCIKYKVIKSAGVGIQESIFRIYCHSIRFSHMVAAIESIVSKNGLLRNMFIGDVHEYKCAYPPNHNDVLKIGILTVAPNGKPEFSYRLYRIFFLCSWLNFFPKQDLAHKQFMSIAEYSSVSTMCRTMLKPIPTPLSETDSKEREVTAATEPELDFTSEILAERPYDQQSMQ